MSPIRLTELSEFSPLTNATWIIPLKTSETSSNTFAEDSEDKTKNTLTINEPDLFGVLVNLVFQLLVRSHGLNPRAGS